MALTAQSKPAARKVTITDELPRELPDLPATLARIPEAARWWNSVQGKFQDLVEAHERQVKALEDAINKIT